MVPKWGDGRGGEQWWAVVPHGAAGEALRRALHQHRPTGGPSSLSSTSPCSPLTSTSGSASSCLRAPRAPGPTNAAGGDFLPKGSYDVPLRGNFSIQEQAAAWAQWSSCEGVACARNGCCRRRLGVGCRQAAAAGDDQAVRSAASSRQGPRQ
ncbi:hypothetical protein PVAP13_5NG048816 [Panicum virgatum]|uniref:Uncharacterized protein n=1 Tax=Panicum virgatum TaxID=38727 RepID=A0A8T0RJG3_PANVG|nr:hypothetical protein PVAP13_5NG048816 [Panicum virgatum]